MGRGTAQTAAQGPAAPPASELSAVLSSLHACRQDVENSLQRLRQLEARLLDVHTPTSTEAGDKAEPAAVVEQLSDAAAQLQTLANEVSGCVTTLERL